MEVKKWTYEEFPEYQDERFRSIDTDGNDIMRHDLLPDLMD